MTIEIALLLLACIIAPMLAWIIVRIIVRRQEAERTAMRMFNVTDDPSVRAARNVS